MKLLFRKSGSKEDIFSIDSNKVISIEVGYGEEKKIVIYDIELHTPKGIIIRISDDFYIEENKAHGLTRLIIHSKKGGA